MWMETFITFTFRITFHLPWNGLLFVSFLFSLSGIVNSSFSREAAQLLYILYSQDGCSDGFCQQLMHCCFEKCKSTVQRSEMIETFKILIRVHLSFSIPLFLAVDFLVAVVNTLNSSKEISELFFENADVERICYCNQRMRSKLSLPFRMCQNKALSAMHIFHLTPTRLVWNGVV